MKPTRLGILLGVTVLSGGVGFLIDLVLTSSGRPTFTPSWLLPVMLVLLGAALVVLAIPIRRSITGMSPEPVDPFRAVRILSLAKASAILGAVIGGLGIGLAVFLLSRPVAPSLGSMSAIVATIVAALALAVAALVTERLCTTGKDDDDEPPGPPEPGFGLSHTD